MFMNPKHEKKGFAAADAVLSEFTVELQNYCRGEKDLAERTRTLRFTRSELTTTPGMDMHGAGKKYGCS